LIFPSLNPQSPAHAALPSHEKKNTRLPVVLVAVLDRLRWDPFVVSFFFIDYF
jgi:hypothetical protein